MKEIKNFNYHLFLDAYNMCIKILNKSKKLCEKEKQYRKDRLDKIWKKMIVNDKIDKQIYEIIHEIKSLELLSCKDGLKISNDHLQTKGPDFKINEDIWIECVTSSRGEEKEHLFKEFDGSGVFNYNKKENLILCRLSGSISCKKNKYNDYIENGIVSETDKNIIFISAGNLYYGAFFGKFGFALNKILFGVGYESLLLDTKTNKIIKQGYTYNKEILNHNNSVIDCNIYLNKDYNIISGIIFSYAALDEHYTKQNTFFFRNPYAKNKVKINIFNNLVYWNIYNKKGEYIYVPRYKGKNLNDKLARKYF